MTRINTIGRDLNYFGALAFARRRQDHMGNKLLILIAFSTSAGLSSCA